jgi:hypothetical protein
MLAFDADGAAAESGGRSHLQQAFDPVAVR